MEENKQKNSRRRLNSLILLVAFTAIMLIVSTYAWFSTQKNVSIANLNGTVKVAEGLEVSLNAKDWSQEIDFSQYSDQKTLKKLYGTADHNIIPTELLPVSTTAVDAIADAEKHKNGEKEITFYRGTNEDNIKLKAGSIKAVNNDATKIDADSGDDKVTVSANPDTYPGYYAIDLFLRNSSRLGQDETIGTAVETLQLNTDSMVNVISGGNGSTGLQNTPRVALALYSGYGAVGAAANQSETEYQQAILTATTQGEGALIKDVAIWEPNANAHVDYIVNSKFYNGIKWKDADVTGYLSDGVNKKFKADEKIPTYALTANSVTATESADMDNLYDWSGNNASLQKQITLQTDTTSNFKTGVVKDLISVKTPETALYTTGATGSTVKFQIYKNTVVRLRMYIWLEGQDPDCVNYASHGGGVEVDLGLIKGAEV